MTRLARILCTLHTASATWLAWLTLTTYNHVPLWATVLNFAASLTNVAAIANLSADADDMRDLRAELERALRPAPDPPQPAIDPLVIPDDERARFDEITAGFEDAA